MTLRKRISNSLTLAINTTTNSTYTTLGDITKMISGPAPKAETIKLDLLNDVYDTKTRGSIDPGQYKFGIAYDPTDSDTILLAASLGAAYSTLAIMIPAFKLTYPAIGTNVAVVESFSGFIAGFDKTGEKNNMVQAEITIEVSGDDGLTKS